MTKAIKVSDYDTRHWRALQKNRERKVWKDAFRWLQKTCR